MMCIKRENKKKRCRELHLFFGKYESYQKMNFGKVYKLSLDLSKFVDKPKRMVYHKEKGLKRGWVKT